MPYSMTYGHTHPFVLRVPNTSVWINVRNVVTIDARKMGDGKQELSIILSNKRLVQTVLDLPEAKSFMSDVYRGSNVYQK